nr:Quinone oxidoreductase 1 [Candidatus Pantoea persica]
MAKRIQFTAPGGPKVLQWVEVDPADPAEREVQVENRAIGIKYIDT